MVVIPTLNLTTSDNSIEKLEKVIFIINNKKEDYVFIL